MYMGVHTISQPAIISSNATYLGTMVLHDCCISGIFGCTSNPYTESEKTRLRVRGLAICLCMPRLRKWCCQYLMKWLQCILFIPQDTYCSLDIRKLSADYKKNSGNARTRQDPVQRRCLGIQWRQSVGLWWQCCEKDGWFLSCYRVYKRERLDCVMKSKPLLLIGPRVLNANGAECWICASIL